METGVNSQSKPAGSLTPEEARTAAAVLASSNVSSSVPGVSSTTLSVPPAVNPSPLVNAASAEIPVGHSAAPTSMAVTNTPAVTAPLSAFTTGDPGLPASSNAPLITVYTTFIHDVSLALLFCVVNTPLIAFDGVRLQSTLFLGVVLMGSIIIKS